MYFVSKTEFGYQFIIRAQPKVHVSLLHYHNSSWLVYSHIKLKCLICAIAQSGHGDDEWEDLLSLFNDGQFSLGKK